jgi:hypothetical protein
MVPPPSRALPRATCASGADGRIRFFLVLIAAPRDGAPDSPFKNGPRLEARLTSGELVDVVP